MDFLEKSRIKDAVRRYAAIDLLQHKFTAGRVDRIPMHLLDERLVDLERMKAAPANLGVEVINPVKKLAIRKVASFDEEDSRQRSKGYSNATTPFAPASKISATPARKKNHFVDGSSLRVVRESRSAATDRLARTTRSTSEDQRLPAEVVHPLQGRKPLDRSDVGALVGDWESLVISLHAVSAAPAVMKSAVPALSVTRDTVRELAGALGCDCELLTEHFRAALINIHSKTDRVAAGSAGDDNAGKAGPPSSCLIPRLDDSLSSLLEVEDSVEFTDRQSARGQQLLDSSVAQRKVAGEDCLESSNNEEVQEEEEEDIILEGSLELVQVPEDSDLGETVDTVESSFPQQSTVNLTSQHQHAGLAHLTLGLERSTTSMASAADEDNYDDDVFEDA